MAERRKIIIQTGAEPDESLSTPHFDAEATMTARPVVPLTEQESYPVRSGVHAAHAAAPFWKRPALLALVVIVAAGIGVAAGLAIGIYRSGNAAAEAPAQSAPPSTAKNAEPVQTIEPPPTPREERAAIPPEPEEEPAVKEPVDEDEDDERGRPARDERKDREEAKPPIIRDKKRAEPAEDTDADADEVEREARRAERQRRREERRERRRRERDEEMNIPRQIERAGRELDRIRDIFEGRQP
jgi:hypothetical protein